MTEQPLDDIAAAEEDQELMDFVEAQAKERERLVQKQADKYMRKHRREIRRLEKHAEKTLLEGNKEGYIYAIGKLRTLIGKDVSRDVLESLWKTSREQVLTIAHSYAEAKANIGH